MTFDPTVHLKSRTLENVNDKVSQKYRRLQLGLKYCSKSSLFRKKATFRGKLKGSKERTEKVTPGTAIKVTLERLFSNFRERFTLEKFWS